MKAKTKNGFVPKICQRCNLPFEWRKKWNRLVQWCKDATAADSQGREFKPLYVTGDNFSEWSGQISQFERFAELLLKEKPVTAAL